MIKIKKSPTADTRTCDVTKVTKEQLEDSSIMHRKDVRKGLALLSEMLERRGFYHDQDKLTEIDSFYSDFKNNFQTTEWCENHKKTNRHHLASEDGIPEDVNLIDVLEYITDCIMAGLARSGSVYNITLDGEILQKAFENTVSLIKENVEVEDEG